MKSIITNIYHYFITTLAYFLKASSKNNIHLKNEQL